MKPQCERLLALRRARGDGGVTADDAREHGAGSRCAARIEDLEALGFVIAAEYVTVPTKWGHDARVRRYRLVERTAPYRGWQPQMFSGPDAPVRADAVGLPPSPVPTAVSPLRAARPATGERAG